MSDDKKEFEWKFDGDNPVIAFCFAVLEYIKEVDKEMYKKASEYAEDITGCRITEFTMEDVQDADNEPFTMEEDDKGEIYDDNDEE